MRARFDFLAIAMGLLFAFIWSSSFTSSRIIVTQAPPLLSLVVRFAISGAIGVAIAFAMGQRPHFNAAQWRAIAVFGLCQNALYLGLNWMAMRNIEASVAAIIASAMPLLVALFGWLFLGERLRLLGVAGLASGIIGVAMIMATRISGGTDLMGVALCVVAVLALTIATLTLRGASSGGNLMMVVGLQMLVGSLALLPVSIALETWSVTLTPSLIVSVLYAIIFSGLVATMVWFLLVRRIGATRAATFHFLNPFFGVAIAAILLGERFEWSDAFGVAVIALGILAVQVDRAR